jgi:hypothetical protein
MAYVPGCRYDLFISYASENNRDGWVEHFQEALGLELRDLLGRQFSPRDSIFFDKKLKKVGSISNQLIAAARESAILVPILSPSYLRSDWCYQEKTEFFSRLPYNAEPSGCLAPIVIRPIERTELDELYRDAYRMSFLGPDEQTPLMIRSLGWINCLQEFAGRIKDALQELRRKCRPIFFGKAAETNRSKTLRAKLLIELERRHFRTVPESLHVFDNLDAVQSNLQDAGLAIHFLGGAAARALDAAETSIERCTGPTILYQPFGEKLTPDEQIWLDNFERRLATARYYRLAGNNHDLLALIDEQFAQVPSDSSKDIVKAKLALVCEEGDLDGVRQLQVEIKTRRPVRVEFPDFLGGRLKGTDRLRKWRDYFNCSEALLFYYGFEDRRRLEYIWQKAQLQKPDAQRDWFLAPPDLDRKRVRYPNALWNIDQVVRFMDIYPGKSE